MKYITCLRRSSRVESGLRGQRDAEWGEVLASLPSVGLYNEVSGQLTFLYVSKGGSVCDYEWLDLLASPLFVEKATLD